MRDRIRPERIVRQTIIEQSPQVKHILKMKRLKKQKKRLLKKIQQGIEKIGAQKTA